MLPQRRNHNSAENYGLVGGGREEQVNDAAVSQVLQASAHLQRCQQRWSCPHCPPPLPSLPAQLVRAGRGATSSRVLLRRVFLTWSGSLAPFIMLQSIRTTPARSQEGETHAGRAGLCWFHTSRK